MQLYPFLCLPSPPEDAQGFLSLSLTYAIYVCWFQLNSAGIPVAPAANTSMANLVYPSEILTDFLYVPSPLPAVVLSSSWLMNRYLGGNQSASSRDVLLNLNITRIVNTGAELPSPFKHEDKFVYLERYFRSVVRLAELQKISP